MRKGFLKKVREREERRISVLRKILENMKGKEIAVILFGSRARGESSASSDFDILVIVRDQRVSDELKEALRKERIPSDLHIFRLEEAKELLPSSSILLDALQEGLLLLDGLGIENLIEEAKNLKKRGIGRVKGGWKIAIS